MMSSIFSLKFSLCLISLFDIWGQRLGDGTIIFGQISRIPEVSLYGGNVGGGLYICGGFTFPQILGPGG